MKQIQKQISMSNSCVKISSFLGGVGGLLFSFAYLLKERFDLVV